MTIINKHRKYLIAIMFLAMILGIKTVTGYRGVGRDGEVSTSELSIKPYTLDADISSIEPVNKDIFARFHQHEIAVTKQRISSGVKPRVAVITQELSHQNENQAPPPVNDGEISRLKLLGIVFHDNKRKAFLALDSQRVIADVGDLVYGRYLLREIAVDSASLMDTKDNVSKTILVSGK